MALVDEELESKYEQQIRVFAADVFDRVWATCSEVKSEQGATGKYADVPGALMVKAFCCAVVSAAAGLIVEAAPSERAACEMAELVEEWLHHCVHTQVAYAVEEHGEYPIPTEKQVH